MAMCPTSLAIFAFSLPESASVRDVQTSVSREPTHSHVCVVFPISYLRPCKSRMVRASRNAPTLRLTISHLCRRPPSPPRQLVSALPVCHSRNGRGRRSRSVPSPDAHWRWGGACNVFRCTHPRQPQAGPSWASSARHRYEPPRFERSQAIACERSTPCYRTTKGPSTPLGVVHGLLLPVSRAAGRRTRRASEP